MSYEQEIEILQKLCTGVDTGPEFEDGAEDIGDYAKQ